MQRDIPEIFERCGRLIAERREQPTDDLTSVLVHAEVDGERLEEHEIVMGFFLLVAAGNDCTKATYCSAMRALIENPDQRELLLDDPSLVPSAVEESLRMFPAFGHFARTATRDVELNGAQIHEGDKVVMWYTSSNRDETRYEDPDRFDVTAQPRAPGVRRGRPALLPGHRARAARAADPDRGVAQAVPGDGAGGRPEVRRVAVRQPAEDAAGPAAAVVPAGQRPPSGLHFSGVPRPPARSRGRPRRRRLRPRRRAARRARRRAVVARQPPLPGRRARGRRRPRAARGRHAGRPPGRAPRRRGHWRRCG